MKNAINHLRKKWNITSNWDFFIICCVFSLAGMVIIYERRPLFHLFGITDTTPFIVKFITWLLIVFPCYQINLIIFGTLFGKFQFFFEKEKKLIQFLTGQGKSHRSH